MTAEFSTPSNPLNQIVLYDKIIEATDKKKVIHEKNAVIKYSLIDQHDELRGQEVTLKLYYDTMPLTAQMYMGVSDVQSTFTLPKEYMSTRK